MAFLKFLLKLSLTVTVILVTAGWYLYDRYQPVESNQQHSLVVNDITGLNPVQVATIVQPTSELDITDAIMATQGPISIGGARYSMGGQIAFPDSLHLDLRDYDEIINFNAEQKLITVQTGITWKEIQQAIDPHDLSIKIMQDFNNFTVGGSLSVNAHGRYSGGPIINSVKSIRIALSNGLVYNASQTENSALFYAAIGGYGGLGVITEATLELVDNIAIERSTTAMDFVHFVDYFKNNILNDKRVVMHNAVLYPPSYEMLLDISWRETDKALTNEQRLRQYDRDNRVKPILIDMIARSNFLKRLRKNLFDQTIYSRPAVVTRNFESSYDLHEFGFVNNADTTMALREYFVPVDNFEVFVLRMRNVFMRNDVNVLNISIRYSPKDSKSVLAWAKEDMFSFVVVYQQGKDKASQQQVDSWSEELIQSAIESGGSYYLPFQMQASTEQFFQVYPGINYYFTLKEQVDPQNRFNNMMWLKYYAANKHIKESMLSMTEGAVPDSQITQ